MRECNVLVSDSALEVGVETVSSSSHHCKVARVTDFLSLRFFFLQVRCNLVIDFDHPRSFREFAHHKVKARAKGALMVFLCDEDDSAEKETLLNRLASYRAIEEKLLVHCLFADENRGCDSIEEMEDYRDCVREYEINEKEDLTQKDTDDAAEAKEHLVDPSGERVNEREKDDMINNKPKSQPLSPIQLLNRYCAKLPSDNFTRLTPSYLIRRVDNDTDSNADDDRFVCALQLPINSPLREVVLGGPRRFKDLAKRSAASIALKKLLDLKELDKNLAPVGKDGPQKKDGASASATTELPKETIPAKVENDNSRNIAPSNTRMGGGTAKRRQYYYKQIAKHLTTKGAGSFFLYEVSLRLSCPIPEDQVSPSMTCV